jgi:hypothetical protein
MKLIIFWDVCVCAASIIRAMMEAIRTSETSVDIQLRARQYIPEDSELHTLFLIEINKLFYFSLEHIQP